MITGLLWESNTGIFVRPSWHIHSRSLRRSGAIACSIEKARRGIKVRTFNGRVALGRVPSYCFSHDFACRPLLDSLVQSHQPGCWLTHRGKNIRAVVQLVHRGHEPNWGSTSGPDCDEDQLWRRSAAAGYWWGGKGVTHLKGLSRGDTHPNPPPRSRLDLGTRILEFSHPKLG